MIDTVRVLGTGAWTERCPVGWQERECVERQEGDWVSRIQRTDPETGLRLFGGGAEACLVEASLPRLLHGSNDRLLANANQVDQALQKLGARIGGAVEGWTPRHVTRLDLVWQFRGDTRDWVQALRTCRHPRVRKAGQEFFGQSLHFPGKELHLRVYDKSLEERRVLGDVVRCEWQMRGKAMRKALANGDVVELEHVRKFPLLYGTFRKLMLGFERRVVVRPRTIVEFIAYLEAQGYRDELGRTALEVYGSGRSLRHQRRLRVAVQSAKFGENALCLDFRELLPAGDVPPVVELIAA